ncbi:hypothetical protein D3C85_1630190 [compost metagenome]
MGVDEIAGTRTGADQAATFQQVIGLEHRRRADAVGLAGVTHRRHPLAGTEDAGSDQFCDVVGEFFVAFHRYPAMESVRLIVARGPQLTKVSILKAQRFIGATNRLFATL